MAPVAIDTSSLPASPPQPFKEAATTVVSSSASTVDPPPPAALTLDYAQWCGVKATEETRRSFVDSLREACAGLGFFYLFNTPLDKGDLRQRIFALSRSFFALPLDVRQRISIVNSPHFRGFSKFGDERTQNAVDHRDQIDYGLERPEGIQDKELLERFPFLHLIGPNQFLPDDILPDHRSLVLQWLDTCQSIAHSLTQALEAALGAPNDALLQYLTGQPVSADSTAVSSAQVKDVSTSSSSMSSSPSPPSSSSSGYPAHPYARMKTIRYPRASHIDGISRLHGSSQGVGAHKDGGWITVLATSPHKGLQVQSLDGRWLDVAHHPHAVVVNFGQQIERVSRGSINAATHRVLSHDDDDDDDVSGDRYSVAYFSMPALNVVVKPLPKSSLCPEIVEAWQRAQEQRSRATGSHDVVTAVPAGDLWGADDAPFGVQGWKGIVRSHPNVVQRYGYVAE